MCLVSNEFEEIRNCKVHTCWCFVADQIELLMCNYRNSRSTIVTSFSIQYTNLMKHPQRLAFPVVVPMSFFLHFHGHMHS